MRIEDLSDNAGDLLRATEDLYLQAKAKTAHARDEMRAAQARYKASRWHPTMWKRLFRIPSVEVEQPERDLEDADVRFLAALREQRGWDGRVRQRSAGVAGEQRLADSLSPELSDDWILFRGYLSEQGETDGVLVGPSGVWVIEVKNRRVRLHVDGDRWWVEKLDSRGNLVGTEDAVDGGGRTWGAQATDVAGALVSWLEHNERRVGVRTTVMIVHRWASVVEVNDSAVDLITADPGRLLVDIRESSQAIDADVRSEVEALIRRDHEFNSKRRPGGPGAVEQR